MEQNDLKTGDYYPLACIAPEEIDFKNLEIS